MARRDDFDDDFDDRTRRPKDRSSRRPEPPIAVMPYFRGAILVAAVAAVAVGGVYAVQWWEKRPVEVPLPAVAKTGVKYVPQESEKRLAEYRQANPGKPLTEAEVYRVMGEPTQVGPMFKVQRDGKMIPNYEAYWKVPGSGVASMMEFTDGVESSSTIGQEVPK